MGIETNYTVREIAQGTGLSIATVSRVLNNRSGISVKAKDKVLSFIGKNSGAPLFGNGNGIFRIAVVHSENGANMALKGYNADLISGIYAALCECQAQLVIMDFSSKKYDESFTNFFRRNHIDGVILSAFKMNRKIAEEITAEGFPCVITSERMEDENVSYIDYDSRPGMARAIDHLVSLGHTRIAFSSVFTSAYTDHYDRRQAYIEGLKKNNIELDADLLIQTHSTKQGGASAIDQLMALSNPPTAIIFTTPPATLGGIIRAKSLGMEIPKELSIVGYDNCDQRYSVFPPYSAVCQDAEQLGALAADAVLERISYKTDFPVRTVLPTCFESNGTTGRLGEEPSQTVFF